MAAKNTDAEIDKDLKSLYTSAKKHQVECPHCKQLVDLGGDFMELKTAMALRLEWEKIKRKNAEGPGDEIPTGLRDEETT